MKQLRNMWRAAVTLGAAALPTAVLAQSGNNPFIDAQNLANKVGEGAGIATSRTPAEIIGQIINVALGFLGIVLLAYLLYAGFLWMTAGGEKDNVEKAQTMIKNAIIGLVIIVAAFAISNFVLGALVNVTKQ